MDLSSKEFIGKVLPDKDPKLQGRYKIHIPHMMSKFIDDGIWCKNHTDKNRLTPSDSGFYGSYKPLQPGTSVIIKFNGNHPSSGYVDRIISDAEENTKIKPESFTKTVDRDDIHILTVTPKKKNIIYISEDSTDVPANEIVIGYNERRSALVVNETGITTTTNDIYSVSAQKTVSIIGKTGVTITSSSPVNVQAPSLLHNGHNACVTCGGGSGIYVSSTAPPNPTANQLWLNTG